LVVGLAEELLLLLFGLAVVLQTRVVRAAQRAHSLGHILFANYLRINQRGLLGPERLSLQRFRRGRVFNAEARLVSAVAVLTAVSSPLGRIPWLGFNLGDPRRLSNVQIKMFGSVGNDGLIVQALRHHREVVQLLLLFLF